jgi:hypothetical protein
MSKVNEKKRLDAAIAQLQAEMAEMRELLETMQQQSGALGQYWDCSCGTRAFIPGGQNPPSNWWIWDDGGEESYTRCPKCARKDQVQLNEEWHRAGWTKEEQRENRRRRRAFIGDERSWEHWTSKGVFLDRQEQHAFRTSKLELLGHLAGKMFPQLEEWQPEDEWDGSADVDGMYVDELYYPFIKISPWCEAAGLHSLDELGIVLR